MMDGVKEKRDEDEDVYEVASQIASKFVWKRVCYSSNNGIVRDWVWRNGYWHLGAEELIEKLLALYLKSTAYPGKDGEAKRKHVSRSLSESVRMVVMAESWTEERELRVPPRELINVKNGILDFTTGELIEPSPDWWFLSRLDCEFRPEAQCPNFMKFLGEVLPPEVHPTIQEFLGYCLERDNYARRAFMGVGSGGNGKSTFLEILTHWLGPDNVTNVTLQDLEYNRFAKSELLGKHLNVFADLPQRALTSTTNFRALTGGDMMRCEQKGKQGFSFQPYAKQFYTTNRLPPVADDEVDAFYDRWIIIDFPNSFAESSATRQQIVAKCTTEEEKSGILNWALEGLRRLMANGTFSGEQASAEKRERWMRDSNPIYDFLADTIEKDANGEIEKEELWLRYVAHCQNIDIPAPKRQNEFSMLVQSRFGAKSAMGPKTNGRKRVWRGIRYIPKDVSKENEPKKAAQANENLACATPDSESPRSKAAQAAQSKGYIATERCPTIGQDNIFSENQINSETDDKNFPKQTDSGVQPAQPVPHLTAPLDKHPENPGCVNPISTGTQNLPRPPERQPELSPESSQKLDALFARMLAQSRSQGAGVSRADFDLAAERELGLFDWEVKAWWNARLKEGSVRRL